MFPEVQGSKAALPHPSSSLPLRERKLLKVLLSPSPTSSHLFFIASADFKGAVPTGKLGACLEKPMGRGKIPWSTWLMTLPLELNPGRLYMPGNF